MGAAKPFIQTAVFIAQSAAEADINMRKGGLGDLESKEYWRALRANQAQQVDALARGSEEAGLSRMQGTRVQGAQRVAYAAGNIDSSSGTAAQLADSTGIYAELDAQTSMNNARREALGFKRVQQQTDAKVAMDLLAKQAAHTEKTINSVGSIIGSIGSFGGS